MAPAMPAPRPCTGFAGPSNPISRVARLAATWRRRPMRSGSLAPSRSGSMPTSSSSSWRPALALYRGDLLATELDAEWADARRTRLRRRWIDAVLTLADLDLAAGAPLATEPALAAVLAAEETN